MKIDIKYKDGKIKVKGIPTKKEKKLYQELKNATEDFYKKVEGFLEKDILEGILEIKVKKKEG